MPPYQTPPPPRTLYIFLPLLVLLVFLISSLPLAKATTTPPPPEPPPPCLRTLTITFPTLPPNHPHDPTQLLLSQKLTLETLLNTPLPSFTGSLTFQVDGIASSPFTLNGEHFNPSLCVWDFIDYDSPSSSISEAATASSTSSCISAGIPSTSIDCQKITESLYSSSLSKLLSLQNLLNSITTLINTHLLLLPSSTELSNLLLSTGQTPDKRYWSVLQIPPPATPSSARSTAKSLCESSTITHENSAACYKFGEIVAYRFRLSSVQKNPGLRSKYFVRVFMIFLSVVLIALTMLIIDQTKKSTPKSLSTHLPQISLLKTLSLLSTLWSHTFGDGYFLPGTLTLFESYFPILPLTILSNGHRSVSIFLIITGAL